MPETNASFLLDSARMRKLSPLLALLLFGCKASESAAPDAPSNTDPPANTDPPPPPPPAGDRTAAIAVDHPLYKRVEAPTAKNDCKTDADCSTGGCSAEVCAAENVTTTCEMPAEGF